MKKFIAAIDGLKYSESTALYATRLANLSNAHLTGVLLDDWTNHSYKIYELVSNTASIEEKREEMDKEDMKTRQESARKFQQLCTEVDIEYNLHRDRSFAIQEILHESIYADLLFIDGKETFMAYEENQPTRFMRTLLANVECPVFIAPAQYEPIKKVVLLYDGEPSSVYAVRMFSYLLPSLKSQQIEVITVQSGEDQLSLPDKRLMTEFMDRHFNNAEYKILRGLPETVILDHLKHEPSGTLVVLGAYRRGMVSRWFRPSMADILMKSLHLPLFIAHS
ncbi:universal stress protein [Pseudoflavitalea rhizosphaerae]|uniref:universal stress protein n=1 Tax=Pseudoflavitalea rhizosphaerae TaxID=1884793 RepID=UPI000F8C4A66|nr:universal stress protein [Pseudoflavitalea rhizosphaerae]